jgi:hypothetical protein
MDADPLRRANRKRCILSKNGICSSDLLKAALEHQSHTIAQ